MIRELCAIDAPVRAQPNDTTPLLLLPLLLLLLLFPLPPSPSPLAASGCSSRQPAMLTVEFRLRGI